MKVEPLRVVGDVVIVEELPNRFEQLAVGARASVDGPVPVVVRQGPAPWTGLDADGRRFWLARLRLRVLLNGQHVPRLLGGLVSADGVLNGFVEEHAGDVTLADLLVAMRQQRGSFMPVPTALALFRGVCVPLATLAAVAPEHRTNFDVKDVFIGGDGVLRSLLDPHPAWMPLLRDTPPPHAPGIFNYLSPEVLHGRPVDERAPMFSAGVLLFELLAAEHPFEDARNTSPVAMLQAMAHRAVPSLAARRADVPAPVLQLVERLTRREAAERFDDWGSVLAAVDDAAGRVGPASPAVVAAFVRALLPAEMQRGDDRREQTALLDLPALRAALPADDARAAPAPTLAMFGGNAPFAAEARGAPGADDETTADEYGDVDPLQQDWDGRTPPGTDAPWMGADGCAMWAVAIDGAEVLVDAGPVTHSAWARFCLATGRAPLTSWDGPIPPADMAELPVTDIHHDEAAQYAAHYGKALPTDAIWQRVVEALGAARLGIGSVWEWTSTTARRSRVANLDLDSDGARDADADADDVRGWVVRGGRFRNTPNVPSEGFTRAWEDGAVVDVGFRCVGRPTRRS